MLLMLAEDAHAHWRQRARGGEVLPVLALVKFKFQSLLGDGVSGAAHAALPGGAQSRGARVEYSPRIVRLCLCELEGGMQEIECVPQHPT